MNESSTPLSAEAQILRDAYAALNRNDVGGFLEHFDPQVERVELLNSPEDDAYLGLDAVRQHVIRGRSTWAEGGCEPERFVVAGDKVVAFVHVRVRLKDQAEWLEGSVTDVFTFRDGKVIQFRTYGDEQQAMEWAGITTDQITATGR